MHFPYFLCPAATNPRLAQCVDETKGDSEPDQWILTRNVTMIIKALYGHGHGERHRDSIPIVPYPNNLTPVE